MGGGEIIMNHVTTNEYMLEGLQDRIDKLAFELWNRRYQTELIEKENNKKINAKNYRLNAIHD